MPSLLSLFSLQGAQQIAATRLDTHLAVTAGAGSGKTRALVARYLNFVEQGTPLRSLIAITFTEKAAREMRSRIRREIENWLANSPLPVAQSTTGRGAGGETGVWWQTAFIELDSARIGTIHALCAELLRLHPAEAGVDPRFTVLEENIAATLQAQAIETALAWAAADVEAARLFAAFQESDLRRNLQSLISNRLDAAHLFRRPDPLARWQDALSRWLDEHLASRAWLDSLAALAEHSSPNADDKLEIARREVLARWNDLQAARRISSEQRGGDAADWDAVFTALRELRGSISTGGQKANWDKVALETVREAMRSLRDDYDETFKPLAGTTSASAQCRWELDRQAAELLPAVRRLFDRALAGYQALKDERHALDFDDLEHLAARLLTTRVEEEDLGVKAVLVDEFQDTNDRQRQIVYALTGFGEEKNSAANLFIVGDAKQGIYRFRGADVAVFRRIQADVARSGGEVIDLDLTFRAHAPLLDLTNRLLAPLMGKADDPARPHRVPFAPLTAYRQAPQENTREPFIEFHLGLGDQADMGRRAAAAALAARLHELREQEGFAWEDIALLFRASTAFPVYEDALEVAGIPFVTVAGKGFYDRPEIRDLLNALAALADPADDLALAGLLRSPAFGLTDADLYHLRFPNGGDTPRPLYQSLISNLPSSRLGGAPTASQPAIYNPQSAISRAAEIITSLHALAGRLPVAELLKQFLDRTHYRAILKHAGGSQRPSRNVDKLLADAHRSRLVSVGDFLEYVQSLRDVGAREGESPADPSAVGGGAAQLMTVHKAKGLEFPLVVIADAGYAHGGADSAALRLDPDLGILLKAQASRRGVSTARPFAWQLGALADADREDAEDLRLLYVAATRAKEKILVSGHAKLSTAQNDPGRLMLSGWLARLGAVIGLDDVRLPLDEIADAVALPLLPEWAASLTASLHPLSAAQTPISPPTAQTAPAASLSPGPLVTATFSRPEGEPGPALSPSTSLRLNSAEGVRAGGEAWRVTQSVSGDDAPAWVVGQIVHAALHRWVFPDHPDFDTRLRPIALEAGLFDEAAIRAALRESRRLLERFRAHPFFAELDSAERHHEVPYAIGGDVGIMDVLYREQGRWTVADFKTDELRDEAEMGEVIGAEGYDRQLRRYADAVTAQFGQRPRAILVFLNVGGEVRLIDYGSQPPA